MSFSRYSQVPKIKGGKQFGTSVAGNVIFQAATRGLIRTRMVTIRQGQRLDILAHDEYGDGRLWWVIAAASGIGWWLQVPPDTVLRVPTNLDEVEALVG